MYFFPKSQGSEGIKLEEIINCYKSVDNDDTAITLLLKGREEDVFIYFDNTEDRNNAYRHFEATILSVNIPVKLTEFKPIEPMKEDTNILSTVFVDTKQFISDNRNTVYTLAAIFLVDHFFLQGKLTARLKAIVEKMLQKLEEKVG